MVWTQAVQHRQPLGGLYVHSQVDAWPGDHCAVLLHQHQLDPRKGAADGVQLVGVFVRDQRGSAAALGHAPIFDQAARPAGEHIGLEVGREGGRQSHRLKRGGVGKGNFIRVQCLAFKGEITVLKDSAVIHRVAHHRVSDRGHVHPKLMSSASLGREFDQGKSAEGGAEDLSLHVVEEGGGRTESKAEKILKWKAKTPFIEGLRKTIRWNIENIPLEADTISSIPEYNRKEYQIAEIKAQTA